MEIQSIMVSKKLPPHQRDRIVNEIGHNKGEDTSQKNWVRYRQHEPVKGAEYRIKTINKDVKLVLMK